jgi:hypothetical protein
MALRSGQRREPKANSAGMRRLTPSSRLLLVALVAVVVLAGAGVGAWYATRGNDGHTAASSPPGIATQTGGPTLSHRAFALLYLSATVEKTRIGVLKQWPNPPYQHYTAGKQECYEWWDKPIALYNLCFENGVLTTKAIE